MSDDGVASATIGRAHEMLMTQKPVVRGRYAKFNGSMDVMLLEALQVNNPFTAKHGTRLQKWQNVAEAVGLRGFKNPAAFSWHTCRDRVTALMKMYTDGKHDKLFKHGTMEENSRKESILREINDTLVRKNHRMAGQLVTDSSKESVLVPKKEAAVSTPSAAVAAPTVPQKRRKIDAIVAPLLAASDVHDAGSDIGFRARILELMESKIQFDMDHCQKEMELREQEFQLQKRFLEYLQSK